MGRSLCVRSDRSKVQKGEADVGFSFLIGNPPADVLFYSIEKYVRHLDEENVVAAGTMANRI